MTDQLTDVLLNSWADRLWEVSQERQMIISYAGVIQEVVREIRALTSETPTAKAIRAADAMRERVAQNDGQADDWGRWHECAAYDDAREAMGHRR